MTSPSDPPVRRVWRARMPAGQLRAVPARQLLWTIVQGAALGGLVSVPWVDRPLAFGLSIGLGALLGYAGAPLKALAGVALTAAGAWAADALGLSPVLASGLVAGAALAALSGPRVWWRVAMVALATMAGAGLGLWAGLALVPAGVSDALALAAGGAVCGLVASNAGWIAAIQWSVVDRVPPPSTLKVTLAEAHREPAMRAWQLDQALASQSPDAETRDGLGEVAAWVYRLAWSQQAIQRELGAIEGDGLAARVEAARKAAAEADDAFTRERREAALRHLEQLVAHRDALALESRRTAALQDYALAFLEQARGGLALSRLSPGEHVPERLSDVLGRLRAHAADGDARRRTARQLSSLA